MHKPCMEDLKRRIPMHRLWIQSFQKTTPMHESCIRTSQRRTPMHESCVKNWQRKFLMHESCIRNWQRESPMHESCIGLWQRKLQMHDSCIHNRQRKFHMHGPCILSLQLRWMKATLTTGKENPDTWALHSKLTAMHQSWIQNWQRKNQLWCTSSILKIHREKYHNLTRTLETWLLPFWGFAGPTLRKAPNLQIFLPTASLRTLQFKPNISNQLFGNIDHQWKKTYKAF